MSRLRVIEGGATKAQQTERRRAGLRKAAELATKRMDDLILALRLLKRNDEADELTATRDAWMRKSAAAVEATR